MDKPTTKLFWPCLEYYLELCLVIGQSSDTVRNKLGGLKKFIIWCQENNISTIGHVNLYVMETMLLTSIAIVKSWITNY